MLNYCKTLTTYNQIKLEIEHFCTFKLYNDLYIQIF